MATRSKYTFLMLPEFTEWLATVSEKLRAVVVLYRGPHVSLELWDGRRDALEGANRVYISQKPVDVMTTRADDLSVGLLGWIQLDVPRMKGSCLFASQVATKSDWFDTEKHMVMNNPATLRLFDRFWSQWKKNLMFPVWAKDRTSGAEAPYQYIGYSRAAAEWFEQGRQLCQEGVANIEYIIRSGPSMRTGTKAAGKA